jgi:hypothetical protein
MVLRSGPYYADFGSMFTFSVGSAVNERAAAGPSACSAHSAHLFGMGPGIQLLSYKKHLGLGSGELDLRVTADDRARLGQHDERLRTICVHATIGPWCDRESKVRVVDIRGISDTNFDQWKCGAGTSHRLREIC